MLRRLRSAPVIYTLIALAAASLLGYALLTPNSGGSTTASPKVSRISGPKATPAPEARFVSPKDGDTTSNPVALHMAVAGLLLEPATVPAQPLQGHFRVIVDGQAPAPGQAVWPGYTTFDYPDGSHLVTLPELSPGPHTLTLIIEDSNHLALSPLVSDTIRITVAPP